MANEKTAKKILEELVDKIEGTSPVSSYPKIINTTLLSLCDLIIEGMGKDWEYTDSKSGCGCGICTQIAIHNSSLSSCKESVRKAMGEEK